MKLLPQLITFGLTLLLFFGCENSVDIEKQKREIIENYVSLEKEKEEKIKTIVQKFYDQLSDPNNENVDALSKEYMAENWLSSPEPIGGKGRVGFVKTLGIFGGMIPDEKWEVKEMLVDGDRVTVRSTARGTPNSPEGHFFGVPTKGEKKFEINTIDIHTVEDGKIVRSYHLEDWASAMQQVAGQ